MADEKKEVVLKITFDSKEAEKRQAEIISLLASQNKGYRELQASVNKAGKATAEEARQLVAYRANISALNTEQRGLTRNIELHNTQMENSADSTIAMRARLSELTQALIRHSKAEIDASESLSAMRQEAKDLSDQLKENESSWGDNRRNVGAYTQGILGAIDGTGLLATVTENLEGAQKAYNATLTVMKAGLAGNISMLKLFKLAMAATGIGAVVLLLGGLVSFLTRTQEGIDFVSRATKGFTTMLGFLTDKLSDVGKKVFDAFSNPKQALIDLVDFIQTNLLNRVKSFAVILEGIQKRDFTKLSDGLFQLSTGVTDMSKKTAKLGKELLDVAKAGAAVEQEFQRIREAERSLNVERSKSRAEIERLKFISEDVNRTEAERIAAAEKAYAMEQSFLARAVKLQNDKVENIKLEMSLTKATAADRDKLAEEQQKLNELQEESFGRQTELNNKVNELRAQGAAQRAAIVKESLEIEKEEIELQLRQVEEGTLMELELRRKLIEKQLEIENTGAEISRERRVLNEKKAAAELLKLNEDYFRQMEIQHRDFATKVLGPLTQEEVSKQIEALGQRLEAQKNLNNAIADSEQELQRTKIDAMSAGVDALKGFFGEQSEAAKAFYLVQKGFAVADIILNLQTEIAKIASANAILGPAGIPLTIAQTLAAKIRAGIGIATIAAQTVQEFSMAKGGIVYGPSHAAGGVRGTGSFANVEVEGGEAVINKNSTARYAPLLSAINVAGGGAPLMPSRYNAAGGIVPPVPIPYDHFAAAARYSISGGGGMPIDYDKLADTMARRPSFVSVAEIKQVSNKVEAKRSKTDI